MYVLRHEEIGEVTLFLVPVGMRCEGLLLEAIFN